MSHAASVVNAPEPIVIPIDSRAPPSKRPGGYRRRLTSRSRVFNIAPEFFSKLCIFSPAILRTSVVVKEAATNAPPVIPLRKDSLVLQRTHWFVGTFVRNAARFFITWAGVLPLLAGGKIVIVEHSASLICLKRFSVLRKTRPWLPPRISAMLMISGQEPPGRPRSVAKFTPPWLRSTV
jgi:hypothetical protein